MLVFAFLFIGLFFTGAQMYLHAGSTPAMNLSANLAALDADTVIPEGAVIPEKENRDSFIAMMKQELIKQVDTIVVPGPVAMETGEDEVMQEEDSLESVEKREIQWCDATVLESQFVASWPKEVSVVEREGARVVVASIPTDIVASGTPTQQYRTLLQLPLRPVLRTEPVCLTNGYIGVTHDGRLIHNNDVILYQGYGSDAVIGYAFDGNPIYGMDTGTDFDVCGGQSSVGVYHYSIRPGEKFILGCFMSEPQQPALVG